MVLLYECFEFDLLSLLNPLAVMHKFKLSYLLTEQGRKSHWIKHTTQINLMNVVCQVQKLTFYEY